MSFLCLVAILDRLTSACPLHFPNTQAQIKKENVSTYRFEPHVLVLITLSSNRNGLRIAEGVTGLSLAVYFARPCYHLLP